MYELKQMDSQQLLHDLREAISDLKSVNPWVGLFRFVSLGSATIGLSLLTWQASQISVFLLGAIATSIAYSFWLICNHDATHRTLTGWNWFDTTLPRLISWPLLLPIGTYNQLHQLHHGYNGMNLQDPERVQWTEQEYQSARSWQRWYVRHQWVVDRFVFGSIGLALKTLINGLELQNTAHSGSQPLRQQIIVDVCGILSTQSMIVSLLTLQSVSLGKYLLFLFALERGVGIVIQTRDHIEHYGLARCGLEQPGLRLAKGNHQLTQLYACRNIDTVTWVDWLMGGLPYHSVHHAFPKIASNHLAEAFERIQTVLERYSLPPMTVGSGYIPTAIKLSRQFCLIKADSV